MAELQYLQDWFIKPFSYKVPSKCWSRLYTTAFNDLPLSGMPNIGLSWTSIWSIERLHRSKTNLKSMYFFKFRPSGLLCCKKKEKKETEVSINYTPQRHIILNLDQPVSGEQQATHRPRPSSGLILGCTDFEGDALTIWPSNPSSCKMAWNACAKVFFILLAYFLSFLFFYHLLILRSQLFETFSYSLKVTREIIDFNF